MSISGVSNSTDQTGQSGSVQQQGQQVAGQGTFRGHHHRWAHSGEDHFTNSSHQGQGASAEDAGLFTVQRVQVFSASAVFVLAQNSSSTSTPGSSASASTSTTGAGPSSTASPDAQAAPASANASVPSDPTVAVASGAAPATPTTGSTSTDSAIAPVSIGNSTSGTANTPGTSALQGLNSSLAALGLNQQEIQAFDQLASLIQALSPEAFTALTNAFQSLAQEVTQGDTTASNAPTTGTTSDGNAANSPVSGTTTQAPQASGSATPATTGDSTPSGGLQGEEIVVRFSEVSVLESSTNGQTGQQSSAPNTASQLHANNGVSVNSLAFQAYSLQVEEFRATLPGNNDQTNQQQVPSQSAATS